MVLFTSSTIATPVKNKISAQTSAMQEDNRNIQLSQFHAGYAHQQPAIIEEKDAVSNNIGTRCPYRCGRWAGEDHRKIIMRVHLTGTRQRAVAATGLKRVGGVEEFEEGRREVAATKMRWEAQRK